MLRVNKKMVVGLVFSVYKKMVRGIDVLELIRRWWVGLMFRVNKMMVGGIDVKSK